MKNLLTIGRIVFAIPFAVFGLNHFIYAGMMAGMVPSFIPGGVFWIYLTGLALIAAAVSIITKKLIVPACLLLGIMLLIFVLTIHLPGLSNPQMAQMAMASLLKDVSLAGAAFFLAGYYHNPQSHL